jgi:hypothetical protein
MTVKELRRLLRKMPDNAVVIVASDAERSDFHPLAHVDFGYWDVYEHYGEFHEQVEANDPDYDWAPTNDSAFAVCLTPEG